MSTIGRATEPGRSPFHEGRSTTELRRRFVGGIIDSDIRVNIGECLRSLLDLVLHAANRPIHANLTENVRSPFGTVGYRIQVK